MFEPKIHNRQTEMLMRAILTLETEEDASRFFEDLCTIPEIKSISQRLEVAQLLKSQATYTEIVEKTGVSTPTIGRVNRALNYGSGGYQLVLEKVKGNTDK
jgi:TrpR-related protein YerC/YecD